ncbi:MAG TPA: type II toxin-antitoxin system HicB family antitoxin [Candidatus Babeliales bacterium]|nr:type II toxin-antitoxin system HicB family antitoxin [Candidatus Babeliales bacterium]
MMKYKGYFGEVTYDDKAKIFHGEVIGLKDIITFQGESVNELKKAFQDSINDYLTWCHERNEQPEKTYSGKLHLRMNPTLHAHLAIEAANQGLSLNDLINQKLYK